MILRRVPKLLAAVGFAAGAVMAAGPAAAIGPGGVPSGSVSPSPPATTVSAPAVTVGDDTVTLLGQTPWVKTRGAFELHLALRAQQPANEHLQVAIYSNLITRTGFDEAADGQVPGYQLYTTGPMALSSLTADPTGGVDVTIPVGEAGTAKGPPEFSPDSSVGSAVYPVQVTLSSASQGQLTTFLVYSAPPAYQKLSVGVVFPFGSAPAVDSDGVVTSLPGDESRALAELATVLSVSDVPASVAATPQTLDTLATGSVTDRSTLATLESAMRAGPVTALPGTYVDVSAAAFDAAGLDPEFAAQVAAGRKTLSADFHTVDPATWVIDGSLDGATLDDIAVAGARSLILPDGDLSALPPNAQGLVFTSPTRIVAPNGTTLSVFGADPGLTADFSAPGGAVLAANRLLADLAIIQLEAPGSSSPRGVAVVPPVGWTANAAFIATVLAGLSGNPFLSPVTASGLFSAVPDVAQYRTIGGSGSSGGGGASVSGPGSTTTGLGSTTTGLSSATSVAPASVQPATLVDPKGTFAARSGIDALGTVFSDVQAETAALNRILLVSESVQLQAAQSESLLGAIQSQLKVYLGRINLPPSTSITLTSTRGEIPLTLLLGTSRPAHVQLRLLSQRLIFRPFSPALGTCQISSPTNETCDLELKGPNTTLKIPVEARSSGVFSLQVSLWTPDGAVRLVQDTDTIHSTAVSGVGIVLIVLAVVSLAAWWVRDLRHGRRARRLVPVPDPEEEEVPDPIDQFFATPPPDYEKPPSTRTS